MGGGVRAGTPTRKGHRKQDSSGSSVFSNF